MSEKSDYKCLQSPSSSIPRLEESLMLNKILVSNFLNDLG